MRPLHSASAAIPSAMKTYPGAAGESRTVSGWVSRITVGHAQTPMTGIGASSEVSVASAVSRRSPLRLNFAKPSILHCLSRFQFRIFTVRDCQGRELHRICPKLPWSSVPPKMSAGKSSRGAQIRGHFPFKAVTSVDVERAVDRFVGHPNLRFIGILAHQCPRDLFRRPSLAQHQVREVSQVASFAALVRRTRSSEARCVVEAM